MGEHSDRRVAQEKKIAQLKDRRQSSLDAKAEHQRLAAVAREKSSQLGPDAAAGNKKAIEDRIRFDATGTANLEEAGKDDRDAVDYAKQIAEAETELGHMLLSDELEELLEESSVLPSLSKELSEVLAVPASKFGGIKKRIAGISAKALLILGNRERVQRLENDLQQSLDQAIRVQLNKEFGAHGIHIFATRFEEKDFASVMRPPLEHLRQALEMKLHTNSGIPIAGRAMFVALTNIGGLFGLTITTGEKMSLPLDDPTVREMIARGALEKISDEKGAAA